MHAKGGRRWLPLMEIGSALISVEKSGQVVYTRAVWTHYLICSVSGGLWLSEGNTLMHESDISNIVLIAVLFVYHEAKAEAKPTSMRRPKLMPWATS
jgi:hypothetical protein